MPLRMFASLQLELGQTVKSMLEYLSELDVGQLLRLIQTHKKMVSPSHLWS